MGPGDTGFGLDRRSGRPRPSALAAAVAVFDLDRTILPGSSLLPLARRAARVGLIPPRRLASAAARNLAFRRYGASDTTTTGVREEVLAVVAGLRVDDLDPLVAEVAAELVDRARPRVLRLIDIHRRRGDFVVVLSASPHDLVEQVAARLGVHRGVGTRAEVDDGVYTGRIDGAFCYREGKLTRLREALGDVDLATVWAYADSASDLPLLEAVGHPVAVHPDRALRLVATAAGWPVVAG